MDDAKKLAFVHNMTHLALQHTKKPEPQHFDLGGPVQTTNTGLAGAVSNLTGTNNQFQGQAAPINPGTNPAQLGQAYTGVQGALTNQTGLAGTLAGQGTQGAGTQSTLTGMLGNEAAGLGPNPAQAALNQNTGANVAQQAALMAGQRGASANPGLLARQAAQQGAGIQQNAAGQEATLAAEQQLAAQQQLQQLAGTQIAQNQGSTTAATNAQLGEQGILQGANNANNAANVAMQSNINNVNAGVSEANQAASNNLFGGAVNAVGSALSGPISSLLRGGGASASPLTDAGLTMPALGSSAGLGAGSTASLGVGGIGEGAGTLVLPELGSSAVLGAAAPLAHLAKGGEVKDGMGMPMHLQHMAKIYHPHSYSYGGNVGTMMKKGGQVPGKPMINHDAYKNDTVDAKLTPGEEVIDLDTMNRKDKVGKAARFVAAHLAKKNKGKF